MGEFLNEVLELSANFRYAKRVITMDIINSLNNKIKECAMCGFTDINIAYNSRKDIGIINAKKLKNIFEIDIKYKEDKVIFNDIIEYYKNEGFFISGDLDMISWHNKLIKYMDGKGE